MSDLFPVAGSITERRVSTFKTSSSDTSHPSDLAV